MSESIHLKLPDGSSKEVPRGTTALEVAQSISPRLADAALVAILREGRVLVPQPQDPLQPGDELFFVTSQDVEQELEELFAAE